MGKEALIREFFSQRERLLQACWAHRLWAAGGLRTSEGLPLEVEFPGWLNTGPGPDFTEARLRIGDGEHFGDVEVHVDEAGWRQHGHHEDPRFRRVVLHVVLEKGAGGVAEKPGGRHIPLFEALPHLSAQVVEVMGEPEAMLRQYEQLPGRCGLRAAAADSEAMGQVIAHAAEARARQKAERIRPELGRKPDAQVLFELIFQSLGYRPYAEAFRELAVRFPLAELEGFLLMPAPEARREVLSRWFGALGLLEAEAPPGREHGADEDFHDWRRRWRALGEAPLARSLKRGGSRPWNSPERRMVGMFHHLYALGARGWLKEWLAFLRALDALRDESNLRKAALSRLEQVFETPGWEPWRRRVSFASAPLARDAQLVGADRAIIVMANAVLPFFLAYARQGNDPELEKLLYRLFIVLPPEAPNRRTRFMERRLMVLGALPRTLRMHQGLLQIHQDFCTSFYEGCEQCRFPELIPLPRGAGE